MERLTIHYEDGNIISNIPYIIDNIDAYTKEELITLLKDTKVAASTIPSINNSFEELLNTIYSRIEVFDYENNTNSKGRSISITPPKGYAPPSKEPQRTKNFSFFDDSDGLVLPKALIFCAIVVTCSMYALLLM